MAYDSKPTGRLIFRIDEGQVEDIQRSWADGKTRKLETVVRNIVETILITAVEKKERFATEAEERRREEQAERERQDGEEQRREEERRVRSLIRETRRWQLSQAIHSYIDAIAQVVSRQAADVADGNSTRAWTKWAREQAKKLDPLPQHIR